MNINTKKYYDGLADLPTGGGIPDEVRRKIDMAFPRYNGYSIEFMKMHNMNDGALYGYSLASEKLKEQEREIERLKQENEGLRGGGWISVEDRLPNFDEHVLVFGEKRGMNPSMGGAYIFICNRRNLKGTSLEKDPNRYVEENQFIAQYVTHWQPLPPPPKSK